MNDDYKKGNKTDDFSSVLLLSDNATPATSTNETTKNPYTCQHRPVTTTD